MLDTTELIRELVAIPGPAGQEEAVASAVQQHVAALGRECTLDAKGNVLVGLGKSDGAERPHIVVTAHLDEIALMVTTVDKGGRIRVSALGGLLPWKWGEQPVDVMTPTGPVPGVVSFGCIHTNSPLAVATQARTGPLAWDQAHVFTGLTRDELEARGVRPGTRIVLARERRTVLTMGDYLVSYFLDDRADIAAWLVALEMLANDAPPVVFAATAAEEVGGEGAAYLLHRLQPEICIALEIGPSVPESPFTPDAQPTVWVTDNYSSMSAADGDRIADICEDLGQDPHWQPLSRGGSDASSAASRGLTARPITIGLPVENSHGLEIMHRDAPRELARLLVELIRRL